MISTTAIEGLLFCELAVHGDERGWFKENWQREKMVDAGLPDFRPVQNNISFNAERGVTRGLHAEPWDKFISVGHGRVFGAWCDLRRDSPTFGEVVTHEIGPDTAVFVPRGVANGFQTLDDNTVYSYLVTAHWSPSVHYLAVNLGDPTLNIPWPIPLSEAIVSDKDRYHPLLSEVTPAAPRRILVIGSTGQLARALRAYAAEHDMADEFEFTTHRPPKGASDPARLLDLEELARDPQADGDLDWSSYRAIINAAAYTQVDAAETPEGRKKAWALNAVLPGRLADIAAAHGIPLVHVSTDYVFDGSAPTWQESDLPAPLNVYGQSKAAGEQAVLRSPGALVVRTSWVIGEGPNFVRTMMDLAGRDINPSVVEDQVGRPTLARDLADGIMHLLASGAPGGIYHLSNTGPALSFAELAREVFRRCGADPERVQPVSTAEYEHSRRESAQRTRNAPPVMAPRPSSSTFSLEKIIATGWTPRDWREALDDILPEEES
ncbi:sugar nucleotide-binding protein [Corynebacterium uropygiale]|uniref:dTDP-4-dehydrorhamnose reductase n=1 Tax=Corynebacterium uropygiale TaxID=1775911 RepID=A0A9X1TYF8_9CORY|nr:bifunctional dTDP-4-dehydrorhamnose 3,5-epimerase family protein/NAD(P)-dependent oxidoreductase [Corynebacterium uropygiale]MCF4005781.1 sugar nucleotide-binding protein [Corynebacterium uropygiale]